MPALKMKANLNPTCCKRDGSYPHVSKKSNKRSKIKCSIARLTEEMENLGILSQTSYNGGCSVVRVTDDLENLAISNQTSHNGSCSVVRVTHDLEAISSQTSHNGGCSVVRVTDDLENLAISSQTSHNGGFCINEEPSMENGNAINQMLSNIDTIVGQDCLSFNGCSDLVVERDSFPMTVSSGLDAMFYISDRPDDAQGNLFEAVSKENITMAPQEHDNNFLHFQMPYMLDSCVNEAYLKDLPSDAITLSDDWLNYNPHSDLEFMETNLMYDLLTHDEMIEAENFNYTGSFGEFQPNPDSSIFNLLCHQAKPSSEEPDVRFSQFDLDRVDYSVADALFKSFIISDESTMLPALVSKETSNRKNITLVLDLDETLVHSTVEQCDNADFAFQISHDKEYTIYVRQRPFLQDFLQKVSEMFEVIIFTASKRLYAEKLLDFLDPENKFFSQRLYRDSCIVKDGTYTKDLTVLGIDLAKVFIIDNSPKVFRLQVSNGIPIESWFKDPSDSALMSILPFLEKLVDVDDVRPIIAQKFGLKHN